MESEDTETKEIFYLIGRILNRWGGIENILCDLFVAVSSGQPTNSALKNAYWAVVSFSAKLKMVDAALKGALEYHDEYLKTWNTLYARIRSKSQRRNEIAHGSVLANNEGNNATLCPYFFSFSAKMEFPNELKISDLKQIVESFDALSQSLDEFLVRYRNEQIFPKLQEGPTDGMASLISHRPVDRTR